MNRVYMTADELGNIPSMAPDVVPATPGVYWVPSDQGARIHLVLVVREGIANTLCEIIRVADHAERQKRVQQDTTAFAAAHPGSVAAQITKLAPEYLNELMAEFITKKELTDRQKIRRRVRALLDLFSADTMWPKGDPAPAHDRPRFGGGGAFAMGGPDFGVGRGRREPDDLAEPPQADAVPAPGAELAQQGMGG